MNKLHTIQKKIIEANALSIQIMKMINEVSEELLEQPWFTITKITK